MRKHIRTLLALGVCLAFLVSGCAFFQQSEGKIITEIVAQDVGYLIARENPLLASALLEYTEWALENVENLGFDKWKDCIINVLGDDEFFRINFEKLTSLIEVDLEGIDDIERRMSVIIPILRSFAEGIRVGLRESKKPVGHLSLADFTWDGELNPNEFDTWKLLSIQPTSQGYFWVFIENPDRDSPIDVVVLRVDSNSNILGYRYFKDGESYLYLFDSNKNKYVRYYFTQEERESCMKCHSNKPEKDLLHEDTKGA